VTSGSILNGLSAACDGGDVVVGGGWTSNNAASEWQITVQSNGPWDSGEAWRARIYNHSPITLQVTIWAICANL